MGYGFEHAPDKSLSTAIETVAPTTVLEMYQAAEIERLKAEHKASQSRAITFGKEVLTLRARVESLISSKDKDLTYFQGLVKERDALQARIDQLEDQTDAEEVLREDNDTLRARIEELEAEVKAVRTCWDKDATERDALQARVEELEVLWIENHLEDILVVKKERDELKARVEELGAALQEQATLATHYYKDRDTSIDELKAVTRERDELRERLARAKAEIEMYVGPKQPTIVGTFLHDINLVGHFLSPHAFKTYKFNVYSDGTVTATLENVGETK